MKKFRNILYLLAAVLCMTACSKELLLEDGGEASLPVDNGINQLVLFSVGNVGNTTTSTTTRATIPYMEQDGRFVCTMFYHAKAGDTDESKFDSEDESARVTTWLKVNKNQGNSVYWNNQYHELTDADKATDAFKDYGFDPNAQAFYWKNRLEHVFVAYADYNKLKTNMYQTTTVEGQTVPVTGSLFAYPECDGVKHEKTGTLDSWKTIDYQILKFKIDEGSLKFDGKTTQASAPWGNSSKRISLANAPEQSPTETDEEFALRTHLYHTANETINAAIDASELSEDDKAALIASMANASPESIDDTHHYTKWVVRYVPEDLETYEVESEEKKRIDFTKPSTYVYRTHEELKSEDKYEDLPANTFDLTRGSYASMNEQPDPILAVTKMKPAGATQEANRVRLYFKHQLAQVQVNLKKAESSTGDIEAGNIISVELLGVSEKAYVFTHPDENGDMIPTSYDIVDVRKYTAEQRQKNPYGTSFDMFPMESTPTGYVKSFNAITFGKVQAIRITWKEGSEDGDVEHKVIFKIPLPDDSNPEVKKDMINLKSGYRYIYDLEMRRGTLAIFRATLQDWLLDDELQYNTNGTISTTTSE